MKQVIKDTVGGQVGRQREQLAKKQEGEAVGKTIDFLLDILELNHLLEREIKNLSGGELQRFSIFLTASSFSKIYIFDEPSSYLDV